MCVCVIQAVSGVFALSALFASCRHMPHAMYAVSLAHDANVHTHTHTHTHTHLQDLYYDTETMDKLIEDQHAPTDHIEVLLDTYAYQLSGIPIAMQYVYIPVYTTVGIRYPRLNACM